MGTLSELLLLILILLLLVHIILGTTLNVFIFVVIFILVTVAYIKIGSFHFSSHSDENLKYNFLETEVSLGYEPPLSLPHTWIPGMVAILALLLIDGL